MGGSREASKKASLMTDTTTLDPTRESLKLPAFEQTAMLAVTKALEAWRDEALNGAFHVLGLEVEGLQGPVFLVL